ncbi:chemotaxis response regulator protein-glutamate methylesterase [Gemmata sp. JC673]|uniref:Protein-glutamate methylesterase/protein-glutamine glutaminase n=1 Tax=Gemmata algarum TaxID=2975278 RepID=A0ABU5F7Z8_9BACT|nr:chemotaxis response regulator protein-glutamate methylesterase [Gemmata algarum]MDY3563461.1 chemotaxis response regulator protein-glutamate methylesterase [Gemmata algarum]
MAKIRVLVVDDAAVFRRAVADELSADPELEVVGTAANGRAALVKLDRLRPDVVLLDIEMPEMDGLEALREIRKRHPRLPVIMFSVLTERGAIATLEALSQGASEYFAKPSTNSLEDSLRVVREELIPEIKNLCAARVRELAPAPARPAAPAGTVLTRPPVPSIPPARVDVIAVAASTGGPNALAEVLPALPANLLVPVLVVQHMPPLFTRLLAERLSARCPLPVTEATHNEPLAPGRVWVAPGDFHLAVERGPAGGHLVLSKDAPEHSCRPAADVLFRSVARAYGPHALAVVLTGMGQDGHRGCQAIRAAGGQVVVQDEESSVVWGMPGFVARAGLADKVLPLALVAQDLARRTRVGRAEAK